MVTVFKILVIAHTAVAAFMVAGYVMSLMAKSVHPLLVWSARLQLVLGLVVTGIAIGGDVEKLGHGWLGVKMLVALSVVGLAEVARVREAKGGNPMLLVHGAAALTLVNIAWAYLGR